MSTSAQLVRAPAVAGAFYPAAPSALAAAVDGYLREARPAARTGLPKALVVPHAGYIYSGPVAGSAYALLAPHAASITRVVLVGPAHRVYVEGVAGPGASKLRTPLGDVEVDEDALASIRGLTTSSAAHAREHSLEVQLPFLLRVAPNAHVVPLVVGKAAPSEVARVLEALWGGAETVVVVSSDLSHYLPYDLGRQVDTHTAERIAALDATPLEGEEACGAAAINGLVHVARAKGLTGSVVDLRSSGDTAGSRDEVVGYGAFAFYEGAAR